MGRLHPGRSQGKPFTDLSKGRQSGRSSGVEHNLAKVGVEGSNPFARSSFQRFHGSEMFRSKAWILGCAKKSPMRWMD